MAEEYDVESPAVTVLGKDMKTVVPYQETISSLREKLERCENVMREKFWDDEKGRFFRDITIRRTARASRRRKWTTAF